MDYRIKILVKIKDFLCILAVIGLVILTLPGQLQASTVDDKKQQIQDLQRQINANRAALNQKAAEANTLNGQIATMDAQIKNSELEISMTQTNIDKNTAEINNLTDQITVKEKELAQKLLEKIPTIRWLRSIPRYRSIIGETKIMPILIKTAEIMVAITPYKIPSTTNGTLIKESLAPTSRIISISSLRVKIARRIVFKIISTAIRMKTPEKIQPIFLIKVAILIKRSMTFLFS